MLQNDHCFPSMLQVWKEDDPNQKYTGKRTLGTAIEPSQGDTSEAIAERLSSSVGSITKNRIHSLLV